MRFKLKKRNLYYYYFLLVSECSIMALIPKRDVVNELEYASVEFMCIFQYIRLYESVYHSN